MKANAANPNKTTAKLSSKSGRVITKPITTVADRAKRLVTRGESVLARKNIRESLVSVAGLIGRPVRDNEGRDLGKLVDIVVRHGEEASDRQEVGAGVHQDEEEDAGGVQARQLRVVRHDPVQEDRHLLHCSQG